MRFSLHLSIQAALLGARAFAAEFDYDEASNDWSGEYPLCGGSEQSPIDFGLSQSRYADFELDVRQTGNVNGDVGVLTGVVENVAGHTYEFVPGENATSGVHVTHPFSGVEYTLAQLHFHWDEFNTGAGSEHNREGIAFPMELHMVMFDSDNFESAGAAQASGNRDALMVIGQWFMIGEPNPTMEVLTVNADEIIDPDAETDVDVDLDVLALLTDNTNMWFYEGSLTTPTCDEIVQWAVYDQPMTISQEQIDRIYHIHRSGGGDIERNWRPTQPLNDRIVMRNFATPDDVDEGPTDGSSDANGRHVLTRRGLFHSVWAAALCAWYSL